MNYTKTMIVIALYFVMVAVLTRTIEGQVTISATLATTSSITPTTSAAADVAIASADLVSSNVDLSISASPTSTVLQASATPIRNNNRCRIFNSTTDPCGINGRTVFFPNNDTLVTDRDVFFQSLSIFRLVTTVSSNSVCISRLVQLLCDSVYPVCDDMSQPRAPCPDYCSCVLTSECRAVWNDLTASIGPQLQNSVNPEFTELLTLTKVMSAQQNCSKNRTIQFYQNTVYSSTACMMVPDSIQCDTSIFTTTVIAGIAAGGGAAILLIFFVFLICCCCCCGCCCRRRKNPLLGFGEQPLFPESGTNTIMRLAQRGRYKSKFRSPRELLKNVPEVYRSVVEPFSDFLIQESRIQTTSFLAEGNHSEVYQGSIVDLQPYETSVYRTVAVKTFREHVAVDDVKEYLKMCLAISTVSHPNVLKIIGVSFNSFAGASIVCPYMEEHDLVTYLKKLRSSVLSPTPAQDFTIQRLVDIVSQVCHGMRALSRKKIVYKMLSAHTCMVDQQQRVTVGDVSLDKLNFLYQQEQSSEYHHHHQKWLAPESIEDGEFSEKSDVWSFGVTAWEILSFGNPPFNDVSDGDFLDYIKSGQSASQPPLCPDTLFNILQDCWKTDPKERTTFLILDQSISALISQPRFASETAIIDKKLLDGDLTLAVSLPKSANSTSRLERQNVPRPSVSSMVPTPIQEDLEASKTDDGYLKVLGSTTKSESAQEAKYVTIEKSKNSENIDETYDYISPVHEAAKEGSPIVSPTLHIGNWGNPDDDDEDGYVNVTPKGSPTPQKSDRHSPTEHLSSQTESNKEHSESQYYNLPKVVPKSERHLSLPKTTKPQLFPKPRLASTSGANGTTTVTFLNPDTK